MHCKVECRVPGATLYADDGLMEVSKAEPPAGSLIETLGTKGQK